MSDESLPKEPELLPAAASPGRTPPKAAAAKVEPHWALTAWWVFKTLAWRNTAAAVWIAGLMSLAHRFEPAIPSLNDFMRADGVFPQRTAGALLALWLAIICELQLTQLILFTFYVLTLPLWLPIHGVRRYMAGRFAGTRKSIPFKIRPLRLSVLVVVLAVVVWWPLPTPRVAFIVGIVGVLPGIYLARATFRFALAPATWVRQTRSSLRDSYLKLKNQPADSKVTEEARQKSEAFRRFFLDLYEQWAPKSIERGLVRGLVIGYFCALLVACLTYLGFLSAIWLRALTDTPAQLAAAIGRLELPDLVAFTVICALGGIADWEINSAGLSGPASVVIPILRVAQLITSVILIPVFFGHYQSDLARVEAESMVQDIADGPLE